MNPLKTAGLLAVGVVVAISLTGCGAPGSSSASVNTSTSGKAAAFNLADLPTKPGTVTMGSADFPESDILAYIYADAMQSKGVKVTMHTDIGERPAYISALDDGSIGAIPEYSGSILDYLDTSATAKSSEAVYSALQTIANKHGFVVTKYAAAQDADTITVTKQTAQKYNLKTIADLKSAAGNLRLGAPAPFQTVPYGVPGLKKVYGVTFQQFVPLSASGSITQTALRDGTVDAADIFSTDPSIEKYGFVSLADPKSLFNAQNVLPLFKESVLTAPMEKACNAVAAKLTTNDLRDLVTKVANGASPATVAQQWVNTEHLGS